MRTDDLVRALVADNTIRSAPVSQYFAIAVTTGFTIAAILFDVRLGPRPDFIAVLSEPRFIFKFVVTLTLAATATVLVLRMARPGVETRPSALALAAGPVLLVFGVLIELASVPSSSWATKLIGTNVVFCLTQVPLLAAPLLVAALIALRHGAPTRPAVSGAVAGLMAGGFGAALYATHCTDDSPLFVATWYSIAIAAVAIVGTLLGQRILRW